MDNKPKYEYGGIVIAKGVKFTIIAAMNENGRSPFYDYFKELAQDYNRIIENGGASSGSTYINFSRLKNYFDKFKDHGWWGNPKQIKKLTNDFFEFKVKETGLRIPFYYDPDNRCVVILIDVFEKDTQRTEKDDLARIAQRKKSFELTKKRKGN